MKKANMVALVFGLMGLASLATAADPSGIWKSSTAFNDQTVESTFKLWLDTEGPILAGYCFDGQSNRGTPITPAFFNQEDGKVGFAVTRTINGQKVTIKYTGTLNGDT